MDMRTEGERKSQPEAAEVTHELAPSSPPPPPSSASSPSHEFSFTISLHPFSNSTTPPSTTLNKSCNNKSSPPSAFDIDLAPADDIFFHGHLLPLHLLSRPTISPRPSDISIEDLRLPLNPIQAQPNDAGLPATEAKERTRPKSLSSFFGFKKGSTTDDKKAKKGLDIAGLLKKYAAMVLFFKGKKEKDDLRRRPYSFSGNLNPRGRDGWRAPRRWSSGGLSVPASKRTSPTNSGLLFASPATAVSSEGSTMEELQNAIQAAIAHCKSSTGTKEDKCKF